MGEEFVQAVDWEEMFKVKEKSMKEEIHTLKQLLENERSTNKQLKERENLEESMKREIDTLKQLLENGVQTSRREKTFKGRDCILKASSLNSNKGCSGIGGNSRMKRGGFHRRKNKLIMRNGS